MELEKEQKIEKQKTAEKEKQIKQIKQIKVDDEKFAKQNNFKLKNNHLKLLHANQDGTIILQEIKAQNKNFSHFQKDTANKIIDGMVGNLAKNGYLTKKSRGVYQLTKLAIDELNKEKELILNQKKNKIFKSTDGIKITAFDRMFLEIINDEKQIDPYFLAQHPKCEAIKKRLLTLKKEGFIKENFLTDALIDRIALAQTRGKNKTITKAMLTPEQQILLKDFTTFFNLTPRQIEEHIYYGNKNLMACDLRWLVEKDVLKKAPNFDVYILSKHGIPLYTAMQDPNAVRYKTKVNGKTSELNHDILIYDAYKDLEKELLAKEFEIIQIKNDRQLRREDALKFGAMQGDYPDLRVYYQPKKIAEIEDPFELQFVQSEIKYKDIEIDAGYDAKTIGSKLAGFFAGDAGYYQTGFQGDDKSKFSSGFKVNTQTSLVKEVGWYCNSVKQATKVATAFKQMEGKTKSKNRTQKLLLKVIDKDGKVKKFMF